MTPNKCGYAIEPSALAEYRHKGFLRLKHALPQNLLQRWRHTARNLEREALLQHQRGFISPQVSISANQDNASLLRYNDVYAAAWEDTLDLLATPAVMAIARQVCGDGAVPLQVDMLFKQSGNDSVVGWHQDAPHSRDYAYSNLGIYLDDAPAGDGCLRYVAGTQHSTKDIQSLAEKHGWDIPGVVEQPAQAGDILLQDVMVLHGSPRKNQAGARRTLYIEMRPWQAIKSEQRQSAEWAELRRQWMALVLERADPECVPGHWYRDYPVGQVDADKLKEALLARREPPIPAAWAVFPVDHPEYQYPTPADSTL